MPVRAIVFDYGNVLSQPQQPSDFDALAKILNIKREQAESLYWKHRVPYDKGEWDANLYWNTIAKDAASQFSANQIEDATALDVASWFRCNKDVVGWAAAIQEAGLKTAILSNMPHELRKRVNSADSWLPKFNHHTYSCVLSVMKPESKIYEHSVLGLNLAAEETLFIDDRQENIDAALSYGMNAILFETTDALAATIERDYSYLPRLPIAI